MSAGKSEADPLVTLSLLAIVLVFVCGFIWYEFRAYVLEALRWIRLGEMWLLRPFTGDDLKYCREWLRMVRLDDANPTERIQNLSLLCFGGAFIGDHQTNRLSYFGLTGYSITELEARLDYYLKWPLIILFIILGVYIVQFSKHTKYKTRHSLESFIKAQVKMWPIISPIVNCNPIKKSARIPGSKIPDKLPIFAEALAPEEWVSFHNVPVINGIPEREATRQAFMLQLGPRFKSFAELPVYMKALLAAWALKGGQKRDESDEMLGRIALCWSEKGGFTVSSDLAGEIKSILDNPETGGLALEVAQRHAYRTTALLGVLQWARQMGGVLAPGQFIWLRPYDRMLWYPLNCLGRRSFHTEGAGALAHFMAEQIAKKPLIIPRVDTAIITLNSYFSVQERIIPPRESGTSKVKA